MLTYDVHQHLWPEAFLAALHRRTAVPYARDGELVLREGRFPLQASDHDPQARLAALDRDGIAVAVQSLQPTLGVEELPGDEREALATAWLDGMLELEEETGGRLRPLAPWRSDPRTPGTCVQASALAAPDAWAPLFDELDRREALLFVHPGATAPPAHAPGWWVPVVDYTSQMQAAYYAWLAHGRDRWPRLRVLFAILAGGAPFQLERRALRSGLDVRSTLDARTFFDVATYGRRAIELCVETYGVQSLAYGSDVPVVDPAPTLLAVRRFGESFAHILQTETPSTLLTSP